MQNLLKTKVLIIGSGPAGFTAAIYTARANLEPILVCGIQKGGQLTITTDVENYPGFSEVIQGGFLMEQMELQAKHVGAKILTDHIKSVDFSKKPFVAIGESGNKYLANSVIISTGASAKFLGLKSEQEFMGFGVSACATCDGFFYRNKIVAVIGGGNTAVEEALFLTNHAKKVYLIHRRDKLRAEKILQERLFKNSKIEMVWNSELIEILGDDNDANPKSVKKISIKNTITATGDQINLDGVFIAIGHKPNTDVFLSSGLEMDLEGYIMTKPGTAKTNIDGIYAAGDVQDKIYRQAITAAGSGCIAAIDAEKFLSGLE